MLTISAVISSFLFADVEQVTMKTPAIIPRKTGLHIVERPEPAPLEPDQIKLQILRVRICGTDGDEVVESVSRESFESEAGND